MKALTFIVALALRSLVAPGSMAQDLTPQQHAAAQVIFDTIYEEEDAGVPDAAEIRQYQRYVSDDSGRSFGHMHQYVGTNDGIWNWVLKIVFLDENWTPDPKVVARWKERFVSDDGESQVYYDIIQDNALSFSSRVWIKHRSGGVQIMLQDSQSSREMDEAEHIAMAKERFSFVLRDSRRLDLLDPQSPSEDEPDLQIIVVGPDYVGQSEGRDAGEIEYDNPDVISIDVDNLESAMEFRFESWVISDDKPYEGDVTLRARLERGPPEAKLIGRNVTAGGQSASYALSPEAPLASIAVRFGPDPDELGQYVALVLWVEGREDDTQFRLILHRSGWTPVLRWFVLEQPEVTRGGIETERGAGGRRVRESEFGNAFNAERSRATDAVRAWKKLAPMVRTRTRDGAAFGPDERVPMGFRFNRVTRSSYHEAWDDPSGRDSEKDEERKIATWIAGAHQLLQLQVWIERDPKPTADGLATPLPRREIEKQQELMQRKLHLEALQLTVLRSGRRTRHADAGAADPRTGGTASPRRRVRRNRAFHRGPDPRATTAQ